MKALQMKFYVNPDLIFIPIILMVIATFAVYIILSKVRVQLFKDGKATLESFSIGEGQPSESIKLNNVLKNQFELPILFYVVCLSLYVTQTVTIINLALAFLFVLFKALHIKEHIKDNVVKKRRNLFVRATQILLLLWVGFIIQLIIKQL